MKIKNKLWIALLFCCFAFSAVSQTFSQRPKIGLCLSGGAAKGIAHISLLKAIDSLGIKVDYITGTSMGSIIGGLYAIGYKGKDLENIILNINWDEVLTNSVSLNQINIEEKDEYGRYQIELPISGKNIRLPSGVIEGQNLMTLLQRFTFRALPIQDFNNFPIPFKCIGADVVKGEPIVLENGNLALALRASMAIPTVFTPVEKGDLLLIDGGMLKNFPVDQVCEMGSDIVIGSYTGGALLDRQNMNNFIKILFQTASYSRLADADAQKKKCQVLIDFDKVLTEMKINITDFKKSKEILKIADKAVQNLMPSLIALADEQRKYSPDIASVHPNMPVTEGEGLKANNLLKGDSIQANAIEIFEYDPRNESSQMIDKKQFAEKRFVSCSEIEDYVSYLYGTYNYSKIFYSFETIDSQSIIKINAITLPKSVFKVGLHYDTELGTGITVNTTLRDRLGKFSRAYAAADVSEQPKVRLDYRKRLGWSPYWVNGSLYYENVSGSVFFDGKNLEDYRRQLLNTQLSINRRAGQNASVALGYFSENVRYKPRVKATERAFLGSTTDTITQLSKYKYWGSGIQFQLVHNTLDAKIFPTKGSYFLFSARLPLSARRISTLDFVMNSRTIDTEKDDDTPSHQYFIASAMGQYCHSLSPKIQLIGDFAMGKYFNVESLPADGELALLFGIGGVENRGSYQLIPFLGNREGYNLHSSFVTGRLSLQTNPYERFYFIPALSFLVGDGYVDDDARGTWQEHIAGSVGFTLGWKTPLGPLQLNISKATNVKSPHTYVSMGYRF